MADKERDSLLREMAQHRGFKLVKSRRRKPGGDFGRYGLKTSDKGEECLGFGAKGLTASADEIESFLRRQTASTWKKSLGKIPKKSAKGPAAEAKPKKSSPTQPRRDRDAKPNSVSRRQETKPAEPPKLRIRDGDAADAEALAALVSEFSPTTSDQIGDRLPMLRHAGEPPIVARLGNDIVGLITWHVTPVLHRPKPVGRITYLQVDGNFRRQGIGTALVRAVIDRLQEKGCGTVEVTSNVKLAKAHAFYRALGFERTSHRFGKEIGANGRD